MSFFSLLIFCFFVWLAVRLVKGYLFYRRHIRPIKRSFEDAYGQAHESHREGSGTTRGHSKIFGKDVGEYVAFEDLPPEETSVNSSSGSESFVEEQQISDAEWEDIEIK